MTAMHPKLSLDGILCWLIPLYNNGLRSILKRHSGQVTTILQSYAILNPTKPGTGPAGLDSSDVAGINVCL